MQLNLFLHPDLVARLDNLAAEFNKSGRTQVAVEILEQCIELYERSEKAKYNVLRSAVNRSDAEEL